MDVFELELRFSEQEISNLNKHLVFLRGLNVLSLAILIYDGYCLYNNYITSSLTLICIGMILCNLIWMLGDAAKIKSDRNDERKRAEGLRKLRDDKVMEGALKQLEEAKRFYSMVDHFANSACHENKQQGSMSQEVEKL